MYPHFHPTSFANFYSKLPLRDGIFNVIQTGERALIYNMVRPILDYMPCNKIYDQLYPGHTVVHTIALGCDVTCDDGCIVLYGAPVMYMRDILYVFNSSL